MCVCVYIYIHTYVCVCVCVCIYICIYIYTHTHTTGRSHWPHGLRRGSAGIAYWDCGFKSHEGHGCLSCQCRVLSGRDLCDELITRPEESYRLWCVVVCDLETSKTRRLWAALGSSATEKIRNTGGITLTGETDVLGEKPLPFLFVHHKSQRD